MSRKANVSDEQLIAWREMGMTQEEIARSARLTQGTVSSRFKMIEARQAAARHLELIRQREAEKSAAELWNTREAAEENYRRALSAIEACQNVDQFLRAVAEIRQHIESALNVLKTLYTAQEVDAWMKDVLAEIGKESPDVQQRIISRVQQRRALYAVVDPRQSRTAGIPADD